MKNRNSTVVLTFALLVLVVTTNQTRAQSIYTPYAFTNFAGLPGTGGNADGTGSTARFDNPWSVAVDSGGNVYVVDNNNDIRKITPAAEVTTLVGGFVFNTPHGLAVDSATNVYVADSDHNTIAKMSQVGTSWVVSTIAGSGQQGTNDGVGSTARFNNPRGVAVDSATNLYVADTFNFTIRKITPVGTNWMVTTLAGSAGQYGTNDGIGSAARFRDVRGVAVDSADNVFVADVPTVRKITLVGTNWEVTTFAGCASCPAGSNDGIGSAARFIQPRSVAVDGAGNVYVADRFNQTIRKITPARVVTTLAGLAGQSGTNDGIGSAARFGEPESVAADSAGNVYVADQFKHRITKGTPVLQFDTSAGLTVSNGSFLMRLDWTGPFGSNAVVDASANLQAWTPVQTNALPPSGLDVSVALATNQNQFFRARLSP